MRRVRLKESGVTVYVAVRGEAEIDAVPMGEILFWEDEWSWILELASGYRSDLDSQRAFWQGVVEKKKENPLWDVFDAFPREAKEGVMTNARPKTEAQRLAEKYGGAILRKLRGLPD